MVGRTEGVFGLAPTVPHIVSRKCGGRIGRRGLGAVWRCRRQTKQPLSLAEEGASLLADGGKRTSIKFIYLHACTISNALCSVSQKEPS